MPSVLRVLRSNVADQRPTNRSFGELYVNQAENMIGFIDSTGAAQDLLAITAFSITANYAAGDFVVNGGKLLRARAVITAGVFNPDQWKEVCPIELIDVDETIVVAPTGNDSTGDGSPGAPFLTLDPVIKRIGRALIAPGATVTVDATAFSHPATYTVTTPHDWNAQTKQDFISIDSAFGTTNVPTGFKIITGRCEHIFLRMEFGIQYWCSCDGELISRTNPDYSLFEPPCPGNQLIHTGPWKTNTQYTTCQTVECDNRVWVPRQNHLSSSANRPGVGTSCEGYWIQVSGMPLVMTVRTAAANEEVYLPFSNSGTYNVTIDWGDGTPIVQETAWDGPNAKHSYAVAGDYTIRILGTATHLDYYTLPTVRPSAAKLIKVDRLGDTKQVSLENAFRDCTNLVSFNSAGADTSRVTTMQSMFNGCSSLTALDVAVFDTSQVTTMQDMFWGCAGLDVIDVTGFDTSQVQNMAGMFNSCSGLTTLDLTGFDTSQVQNMLGMFVFCSKLKELDVSGFDTSKVRNMTNMFHSCSGLKELDVSGFDTSQVQAMAHMFFSCSGLTTLDVSGFDTAQSGTMESMFNNCTSLTKLDVSGFDTSQVISMKNMFNHCDSVTALDVTGFNTSQVNDMSHMFSACPTLTALDVSGFDTSQVTLMNDMFWGCGGVSTLDLTNFDTSEVVDMSFMFFNCTGLTTLDLSSFDTSKVTAIIAMFSGCTNLGSINFSSFTAEALTGVNDRIFSSCSPALKDSYDQLLVGFASSTVNPGVTLSALPLPYSAPPSAGATAHAALTSVPNNWVISDAGPV